MIRSIVSAGILLHQLDVFNKLLFTLVLTSFGLQSHFVQRDRLLHSVPIVWILRLVWHSVKDKVWVYFSYFSQDFFKYWVQLWVALFLASAVWCLHSWTFILKVFFNWSCWLEFLQGCRWLSVSASIFSPTKTHRHTLFLSLRSLQSLRFLLLVFFSFLG